MNQKHHRRALFGAVAVAFGALPPVSAFAQDPEAPPSLESLTGIRPPDPVGTEAGKPVVLADYIVDRDAAIRLGKASFWDLQLGSDGKTACASCHFYAGGNRRFRNTLAPGPTTAFDKLANSAKWGPNHQVNSGDFPTHVLADPNDRESAILSSTDDVIGAQGVFNRLLKPNKPGMSRFDKCDKVMDTTFQVGGVNVPERIQPCELNILLNIIRPLPDQIAVYTDRLFRFPLRQEGPRFYPVKRGMAVHPYRPVNGLHRHNHPGTEEIIFVLSGEGEQMIDDQGPVKIRPGASMYIPADVYHSTINTGWEPLRLAVVYSPAGAERGLGDIEGCEVVPVKA